MGTGTTVILRPNAVYIVQDFAASAGSVLACVSDNSDATWAISNLNVTHSGQVMSLDFGSFVLPARAVISRITPFVRASQASGSSKLNITVGVQTPSPEEPVGPSFIANYSIYQATPTPTIQTFRGPDDVPTTLPNNGINSYQSWIYGIYMVVLNGSFVNAVDDQKVYDIWIEIEYNVVPVVSTLALYPLLADTLTTRPGFSWTYTDAEGDLAAATRVAVHLATDVTDPNFVASIAAGIVPGDFFSSTLGVVVLPKGGTGAAANGLAGDITLNTAVVNYTLTKDLVSGTAYRAYIQVAQNAPMGLLWSTPVYIDFTINVALPATPVVGDIVATYDPISQATTLALKAHLNDLPTANMASLETGTTGWTAMTNTTITQSAVFAADGTKSLLMTSIAAGDVSAQMAFPRSPATPGISYTAIASVRSGVIRSCRLDIVWYDAASAIISTTAGAASNSTTGGFTQYATTAVAPALAVTKAIRFYALATAGAGELHYVDKMQFAPGSTIWSRGGLLSTAVYIVERSSDAGVTWYKVPSLVDPPVTQTTQLLTVYDTVPPIINSSIYRLSIKAIDALGYSLQSLASPSTAPLAAPRTKWMLADPNNVLKRTPVQILGDLQSQREENQGFFVPLGGDRFIVVSDTAEAPQTFSVNAVFRNEIDWQAFQTLRRERQILALTGDYDGAFWWVRIAAQVQTTLINSADRLTSTRRARYESFGLLEVDPVVGQPRIT